MAIINEEEYEYLIDMSDDVHYIARDYHGRLWAYEEKPYKTRLFWVSGGNQILLNGYVKDLFEFIQWSDDEPYSINDLIEEYQEEHGVGVSFYEYSDTLSEISNNWKEAVEKLENLNRKQSYNHADCDNVIPKYVAEFVESHKDKYLIDILDDDNLWVYNEDVAEWLYDNDRETNREREFSLVLALRGCYTIEEEQKYYVLLGDNKAWRGDGNGNYYIDEEPYDKLRFEEGFKLSEMEINLRLPKGDVLFDNFAVKVEEVDG